MSILIKLRSSLNNTYLDLSPFRFCRTKFARFLRRHR